MSTTFSFGGTALSTYGKVTQIDDYLGMADRRGENQIIPYRHGTQFVAKFFNERTLMFGITINAASAAALESTMDDMRAKFAPNTEQTLQVTLDGGAIRNAQATVNNLMQVERIAPNIARVVVEFTLCSPFFRNSAAIDTSTVTVDGTPTPNTHTVTNPGTVDERDPTITYTGPLKNPSIYNSTNAMTLAYSGTINTSSSVILMTSVSGEYIATHNTLGNVIGNFTHSGAGAMMVFNVSSNSLIITDTDYAGGTINFTFYAPYF